MSLKKCKGHVCSFVSLTSLMIEYGVGVSTI